MENNRLIAVIGELAIFRQLSAKNMSRFPRASHIIALPTIFLLRSPRDEPRRREKHGLL